MSHSRRCPRGVMLADSCLPRDIAVRRCAAESSGLRRHRRPSERPLLPRERPLAPGSTRSVRIAHSCPSSRTAHTLSRMELLPSAHVDTFCRDHLPPADQWPELTFDLPELQFPPRLNCATSLLDDVIARYGGDRPCLHQ